jgi:hypothetical protein
MSFARSLMLALFVLTLTAGSVTAGESGALFTGELLETLPGGGYIYLRVSDGEREVWAAVPSFSGAVGDQVSFSTAMPMNNFESKSLDRTFDLVYFISQVDGGSGKPAEPNSHARTKSAPREPAASGPALSPPDGGYSIAELYAKRQELGGKTVLLRGRVTKFNSGILGSNWLHIEDGSGSIAKGDNDLTITTQGVAGPGDVVEVMGTLSLDKDFGAGYVYALIVENAILTKE